MTVAVPSYEVLASAVQLPDSVSAGAVAELTHALGRPPGPSELRALMRRDNGRDWVMAYREPILSRAELGANVDQPWRDPAGMRARTCFASITEAAIVHNDPAGPEAEMRRRDRLHDQFQRDVHDRNVQWEAQHRAEGRAADEERQRQERAKAEFRWQDWGPLPPEAKLAYSLALAIDDGKDLAIELRRLGGELARTKTLSFPARRWW